MEMTATACQALPRTCSCNEHRADHQLQPVPRWPVASELALERTEKPNYTLATACHPINLLVVLGIAVAAVISRSSWLMAMGLALDMVVAGAMARFGFVKNHFDRELDALRAQQLERARDSALVHMFDQHRLELEKLERLVEALRVRGDDRYPVCEIDRLLAIYARLGVSYRTSTEALARTRRDQIEESIVRLEGGDDGDARLENLRKRRLSIAHERLRTLDYHRRSLEERAHLLAVISDLIHLVYERAMAGAELGSATDEVEKALELLDDRERAWAELDEIEPVPAPPPRLTVSATA